ncbi:Nn.00g065590.m01.CDS01 [Neocucurbitaria sp. VM-36]
MAVLSSCPGLTVEITVDDEPLPEYDDQKEKQTTDTKTTYIEAKTGAEFAVKCTFAAPFPAKDLSVLMLLDGVPVKYIYIASDELKKTFNFSMYGRPFNNGQSDHIQKFRFAELTLVEDSTKAIDQNLMQTLALMGMATIKLHHAKNYRKVERMRQSAFRKDSNLDDVPEKALKGDAKTHHAILGKPTKTGELFWSTWDQIGDPFATVHFKYRSLSALKSLGIIPRTPSPVPLEERAEDDLSPEELRQLVRQLKERDTATSTMKKEAGVKRERALDIDDENHDEVVIVDTRSRKRHCSTDKEVVILD